MIKIRRGFSFWLSKLLEILSSSNPFSLHWKKPETNSDMADDKRKTITFLSQVTLINILASCFAYDYSYKIWLVDEKLHQVFKPYYWKGN